MNAKFIEKIAWALSGAALSLLLATIIGGVYTITPPYGSVDVAYKVNRFTGKVWLIKTYARPFAQGQLRVIAAREAEVEKTRDLTEEDMQSFVVTNPIVPAVANSRR